MPSASPFRRQIRVCCVANMEAVRFLLLPQLLFLKERGYDISVVCPEGRFNEDIKKSGVRLTPIPFQRKMNPFSDLLFFIRLFFYFRKEKFDIVHTHNPKPELFGQLAARLAGVPIIVNTVHGFPFNEKSSFLKRRLFILIEKIAALCSDHVFSQSEAGVQVLIKEKIAAPEKVQFLGNGIDLKRFDPMRFAKQDIEQKKQELGIDPHTKIIGIVARLVREKGYLELFEAFSRILVRFPQTMLLIVGPQETEKSDALQLHIVKKYGIEKNVKFLGERTDVDSLYPVFDIFVLPSWREGFPRSVLEASAMARAVIATDISGCREAVVDGSTGILVPIKNPEQLFHALEQLLEDPEKTQILGKKGQEKAAQEFDERLIFQRIAKEYELLIKEKLSERYKVCWVANMEAVRFFLMNQLQCLMREGYEVSVVCRDGRFVSDMRAQGLNIKTVNFTRRVSIVQDLIALFQLVLYFRKEKFDIVHTHNPKPAFFGQLAARLTGVPIVMNTLHGFSFNQYSTSLRRVASLFLERITARFSSRILSVSKINMQIAIEKHICTLDRIHYVGNGIELPRFRPERFSPEFIAAKKKELRIGEGKKVVGVIARLVKEKGYLDLFQAWQEVAEKFPEALLLIIGPVEPEKGDAVDPEIVKSYGIAKSTIFLGERLDVDELYPLMDVFVLPSHREGLPYSLLEASAMEKPIVATDVGGCREIIEHHTTGILIPAKSPDQLAQAIMYLFEHPKEAALMGKNARAKVERGFDEQFVFQRLREEYQELVSEYHSKR
ncbi:MAG: glycosyltransferase family 4 protein [Candidatus Wildermuthbacteria bacterium]|nr:glycosyltransferase family 4 protein [Candidatus Wildermuthbacteria bacterium]